LTDIQDHPLVKFYAEAPSDIFENANITVRAAILACRKLRAQARRARCQQQ